MRTVPYRTPEGIQEIPEHEFYRITAPMPTDVDRVAPSCCGGVGYVRLFAPLDSFEFGKIAICQRCRPKAVKDEGPAPWAK